MVSQRFVFPALWASLILGGCASTGASYPSLAIRDAERVEGSMDAPDGALALPSPAALSGVMLQRVEQLEGRASSAHRRFQQAAPAAQRSANSARGAAVTTNAWADAQIALGDLDTIRSQTAIALADLDLMFVDATLDYQERGAIGEARERVLEMVRAQDRTLAQLRGIVG